MPATILAAIDPVSGWTLFATIVIAIATIVYVSLTYRIMRAQTDPCVIVYLKFDGVSHILLVTENVGNGVARDVRFKLSRQIPMYAAGLDVDSANIKETMTKGPLINGIPALKPGESREHKWGQCGGLKKALGDEPVKVTCHFKRLGGQFGNSDEDLEPVECLLEIDSFEGLLYTPLNSQLASLEQRIAKLESNK